MLFGARRKIYMYIYTNIYIHTHNEFLSHFVKWNTGTYVQREAYRSSCRYSLLVTFTSFCWGVNMPCHETWPCSWRAGRKGGAPSPSWLAPACPTEGRDAPPLPGTGSWCSRSGSRRRGSLQRVKIPCPWHMTQYCQYLFSPTTVFYILPQINLFFLLLFYFPCFFKTLSFFHFSPFFRFKFTWPSSLYKLLLQNKYLFFHSEEYSYVPRSFSYIWTKIQETSKIQSQELSPICYTCYQNWTI